MAVQAVAIVGVSAVTSTSGLGDESIISNNILPITLGAATSSLGSVTPTAAADVDITGLLTTSGLGGVNVWGLVDTSQTPNYSTISTSQTPNWSEVA